MEVPGTVKVISLLDAQYLQDYLALNEEVMKKAGPTSLLVNTNYGDNDSAVIWRAKLIELNKKAETDGVTPSIIRRRFVAQDAMTNSGGWYSSSNEC